MNKNYAVLLSILIAGRSMAMEQQLSAHRTNFLKKSTSDAVTYVMAGVKESISDIKTEGAELTSEKVEQVINDRIKQYTDLNNVSETQSQKIKDDLGFMFFEVVNAILPETHYYQVRNISGNTDLNQVAALEETDMPASNLNICVWTEKAPMKWEKALLGTTSTRDAWLHWIDATTLAIIEDEETQGYTYQLLPPSDTKNEEIASKHDLAPESLSAIVKKLCSTRHRNNHLDVLDWKSQPLFAEGVSRQIVGVAEAGFWMRYRPQIKDIAQYICEKARAGEDYMIIH